jgi:hypothetical protein
MNPKVCKFSHIKKTLVGGGNIKYNPFLRYFDYILEPIIYKYDDLIIIFSTMWQFEPICSFSV